jgi:hypothetical protein
MGISVDSVTDVAKDAADVILLDKDLDVLADGVTEGRRIFANTLKYVLRGTSSNFGNIFSAAGASLFLSFLPMLPSQIPARRAAAVVPRTGSAHATCRYSWTRPPSRSRRSTRMVARSPRTVAGRRLRACWVPELGRGRVTSGFRLRVRSG